ncbi:hypothetical protein C8N35_1073 [Breoghania corrubedonensis]|uniref:Uncharacterized protein n=1 Tax=Breoghania corrubedonensis TaxID=665038 RepID=A0A2T5V6B2_9HYPH|nr:hypothetical protein C8N35_1073 [Breoghania corrubedonensis]
MCRRISERPPKHCDEVAGRCVAESVGYDSHRIAACEHFERMRQLRLLSPLRKAQSCLGQHEAA